MGNWRFPKYDDARLATLLTPCRFAPDVYGGVYCRYSTLELMEGKMDANPMNDMVKIAMDFCCAKGRSVGHTLSAASGPYEQSCRARWQGLVAAVRSGLPTLQCAIPGRHILPPARLAARFRRSGKAMTALPAWLLAWLLMLASGAWQPVYAGLPDTIERVKPSIVGIGTLQHQRRQRIQVRGTGFVVGDGNTVITNAHVVPRKLNEKQGEFVAVFYRQGKGTGSRRAVEVARDETHDISVLRIRGKPMRALTLSPQRRVREGDLVAFTGFPIGAVLGLYPATHRGIVSALTPFAIPVHGNKKLTLAQRKKLARPFQIYQLDAVAYPGNSGSPVYDIVNGGVVAVINSVFVKNSREDVLAHPSGISFAIPIRHAQRLLEKLRKRKAGGG